MNTLEKSPEWKAVWRSRIGGGRAAAAAGIHEYCTKLQLYEAMVNGHDLDPESNPNILRGLMYEQVAIERLKMLNPHLEFSPHDQSIFIYNERYPWAHDLPDQWVSMDGKLIPVRIKVPTSRNWEKLDEGVPLYIQAECVHSAAVNNTPACLLACMHPETLQIYRQIYEGLPDAVEALMQAEQEFYDNHIVPRIPPDPRTSEDLRLRWPRHAEGKRIKTTEEIEKSHAELMQIKEEAKTIGERIEDLNLTIKTFMEDSEVLIDDAGRVIATYKSHVKEMLDAKRLKAEAPVLYNNYVAAKPVRVFLPK